MTMTPEKIQKAIDQIKEYRLPEEVVIMCSGDTYMAIKDIIPEGIAVMVLPKRHQIGDKVMFMPKEYVTYYTSSNIFGS